MHIFFPLTKKVFEWYLSFFVMLIRLHCVFSWFDGFDGSGYCIIMTLFPIWFYFFCLLFDKLHTFVLIVLVYFRNVFFIVFLCVQLDVSTKFWKQIQFYVFEVLFLEYFLLLCFEFDRFFELLDWHIITKQIGYFIDPSFLMFLLFLLPWTLWSWLTIKIVMKLIANCHILLLSLFMSVVIQITSIYNTLIIFISIYS